MHTTGYNKYMSDELMDRYFDDLREITQVIPDFGEKPTYLAKIDGNKYENGDKVDAKDWEPILGGELLKIWDTLLLNEGDELIIRGSTLVKLLECGGVAYDPKTNSVPAHLRSDLDIIITDPAIEARKKILGTLNGRHVADDVEIAEVSVQFTSLDKIRSGQISAMNDLLVWTGTIDNQDLRRSFEQRALYILEQLEAADTLQKMKLDCLFPYEGISLKLKRTASGELEATKIDLFEDPVMKMEKQVNDTAGIDNGYLLFEYNHESPAAVLLDAFLYMEDLEMHGRAPLWALEEIPRMIKTTCELDIELSGEGWEHQTDYATLWAVAGRMAKGDKLFHLAGEQYANFDIEKWYKDKMQTAFARSAPSAVLTSCLYMTAYMPNANLLDPELGTIFNETNARYGPDNALIIPLKGLSQEDLPTTIRAYPREWQMPNTRDVRALINLQKLETQYFGAQLTPMYTPGKHDEKSTAFYTEHANRPTEMSQVIAMILVAAEFEPDTSDDIINRIVSSWAPTGELELSWKTQEFKFDTGINSEKIIEYMHKMKNGEPL